MDFNHFSLLSLTEIDKKVWNMENEIFLLQPRPIES